MAEKKLFIFQRLVFDDVSSIYDVCDEFGSENECFQDGNIKGRLDRWKFLTELRNEFFEFMFVKAFLNLSCLTECTHVDKLHDITSMMVNCNLYKYYILKSLQQL